MVGASASMNRLTVEPEPTPITPSCAYLSAASATLRLSSSWVNRFLLRRQVGADGPRTLRRPCRPIRWSSDADGWSCRYRWRPAPISTASASSLIRSPAPVADDAAADDAVVFGIEDELGEAFVARIGNRAARGCPGEFLRRRPWCRPSSPLPSVRPTHAISGSGIGHRRMTRASK